MHAKPWLTFVLLCILAFSFCSSPPLQYHDIPKIDHHVHLRTPNPTAVEKAKSDNFRFLTICTRSSSQEYIDDQRNWAIKLHQQYPEIVSWATTFSMEDFGEPSWQDCTIARLQRDFDAGAIGVKVWKDIGMTFRNPDSSFIMIDDPRFDPIFEFIAAKNKTLIAHIGEPLNCWLPLDSMTVNSDRGYFERNPEYHMYLHPDYPSHQTLMRARNHVLAKHPNLRVIGCHLGSLEWDVDTLAACLDKYANFAVDMSARVCHFQVQDRDKVRSFIRTYSNRLRYGTDIGIRENHTPDDVKARFHRRWTANWAYFSTDSLLTSDKVNGEYQGLKLSDQEIKRIYYENAQTWYPGLQ